MINKKKKLMSLSSRRSIYGIFFVLPFIIGFIIFFIIPIVFYIYMAFCRMSLSNDGVTFEKIGLENFIALLSNITYINGIKTSLIDLAVTIIPIVLFSLFLAIILNQKFKGRFLARAIFFLPVIAASGVVAMSKYNALSSAAQNIVMGIQGEAGGNSTNILMNSVISLFGSSSFGDSLINTVSSILRNIYNIITASGVQILIFLAGLQTISPSLYEASHIDGSTAWENFWKITFPLISPLILVNVVYTLIDCMAGTNNDIVTYMYQTAMQNIDYTLSAAMGVFYFIVTYLIVGIAIFIVSKFVFYEES